MSWVAPIWLAIAGLVAAGVVVAHLITRSQPRRDVLPTARFIPQTTPLTVTRTRRPTDLLLLLTRVLAVALLGFALAAPHVTRGAPARVIIADVSRTTRDTVQVRDSVQSLATDGAVVVTIGDSAGPSTLSGAIVAAHRAIAGRDDRRRTELVVVSPLMRQQIDSATRPLLALWPGSVRLARVGGPTASAVHDIQVRATGDDAVVPSLHSRDAPGPASRVRVLRNPPLPTSADSAWARDSAGALVLWPAQLANGSFAPRAAPDVASGIAAGEHVVIGTFARTHTPGPGRALVRWLDGDPAATERALGTGCIRDVAIPVDAAGDLALRESFKEIVQVVTSACGGPHDFQPVDIASLLPASPSRAAAATASVTGGGRLAAWLALAALALLLAEQVMRRRRPA